MKVYAIRKRRGQWAVCCEENVLLQFETYAEAVEIARAASVVLASRRSTSVIAPSPHSPSKTGIAAPSPLVGEGSPVVHQEKSGEGWRAA
jgi:hypothetical protein